MGIRGRLLVLVVGAAVPLAALGLWGIRREWDASREHLNELVVQQAQLAAVAFERWVDTQQQPLITVAAAAEQLSDRRGLQGNLRFIMAPRPDWVDVHIVDAKGAVIAAEPGHAVPLSSSLSEKLIVRIGAEPQRAPVVETDWTGPGGQAIIAVGVPLEGGGAVIARIDAAAMNGLFDNIRLDEQAILTMHDEQRRIIYRSGSTAQYAGTDLSGSTFFTALGQQPTAVIDVESPVDGVQRIYGLARAGPTHYTAVVGVPSSILYRTARLQLTHYLLFSLLALSLTGLAALLMARGIALPVSRLTGVAHRFGAGELDARAPRGGGHELMELSETFNMMAARIKEREERLGELDRLKSEFVSGVSHELRTPLTTIKTLARVLLHGTQTEAERRKYIETIAAQCDRQIDLVLNLLDLSRIESGALNLLLEPVELRELLRSCVKIESAAAELHGHTLQAELPERRLTIAADRSALRRVICSLVENAIKYTPDGGRISISVESRGDVVRISITDSGRGIAPSDVPHVFDKFYRGQPPAESMAEPGADSAVEHSTEPREVPGVGLGLYLANNIIRQMGGTISVESEVGRGSTFIVQLPARTAGEAQSSEPSEGAHDGKTVASGR